jgi:hypothetical protein
MRAVRGFLLPAIMVMPMLGNLLGCTQLKTWDDYASKTETMKFLTFEPCDAWFVSELPEHQVYFHVTGISPNADGSYRVEYQQQSQWVFENIYFRSVQYLGLRDFTAVPLVWVPSDAGARCAALVVLPWSPASKRPFFYQDPASARAAAVYALSEIAFIDLSVLGAIIGLLFCAADGFSPDERDGWAVCLLFWLATVVLNGGVWCVNALALVNVDAMASFYAFYDALPTSGRHLLPLAWSQAHELFDGPPHPASIIVNDGFGVIAVCLSCAVWLGVYARRIGLGVTYAWITDPFEELRQRLAAEGRVPTPEDYLNVLMQTGATMSTRRLGLLKRWIEERISDA